MLHESAQNQPTRLRRADGPQHRRGVLPLLPQQVGPALDVVAHHAFVELGVKLDAPGALAETQRSVRLERGGC